jgi:hypothetical protein
MGRLGGALSGPASGSESGIVYCRYHRTRRGRGLNVGSPCKEWQRKDCDSCSHKEQNRSRDDHALGCAVTSNVLTDPVFVGDDITKRMGFVIQRKYLLPSNLAGSEGLKVADCILGEELSGC